MVLKKLLFCVPLLANISAFAQLGGKRSFDFLHVPAGARQASLGGVNVSLAVRDLNFFYSNPALAGDTLAHVASASYQFYVADIGQAVFSYSHPFKRIGTLTFGVQHLDYGSITGYDASGQETADFNSGETALVISKSHTIAHFRFGANIKAAFSNIAGYRSSALALDLGGLFIHPEKDFTVGLAIKNLGIVLSEYSQTSHTTLPFDVQIGTTFKPEHMPLRFSITAYNLVSDKVTYYDPVMEEEEPGALDKVLRRFNFGTELLIHRNVNVMVGYNYRVHQELKLENGGGGAGITFGFSARIRPVEFVFSRSGYVAGKAGYAFTLSADMNTMLKRREKL
jgi:hypothetical protein